MKTKMSEPKNSVSRVDHQPLVRCLCGCGQMVVSPDKRGRPRHWIKGHQIAYKARTAMRDELVPVGKQCKNCNGEIMARYSKRGDALKRKVFCCKRCNGLWAAKNNDTMQRTAAMREKAWTPEIKAKRAAAVNASPKRMNGVIAAHQPEVLARAKISMAETRARTPYLQRLPENITAVWWRLRDSRGRVHEFKNLSWFITTHPDLFLEDDINWEKPTRSKAYGGISSIRPLGNRKKVNGSWKGWTWYSQTERLHNEGRDLLERQISPPNAPDEATPDLTTK